MPHTKGSFENAINLLLSGFTVFMFIAIATSCFLNFGRSGYNRSALIVYAIGAVVGLGFSVTFWVLQFANVLRGKPADLKSIFRLGHIAEESPFRIFQNVWFKFGILTIWTIIVIALSMNNFQIWGSPNIYSGHIEFATAESGTYAYQEVGALRSIWDIGVVPGYTEDMASFGLSVTIAIMFLLILWLWYKATNWQVLKFNTVWLIIAILISCPIAAFGVGNIVPGFTKAHELVGGHNVEYLIAAWIFQSINLIVMWFTFFIPSSHIVHNSIFALGFSVALSIALFGAIPLKKLRRQKNA